MELVPEDIEKYVAEYSDPVSSLLEELAKETYDKTTTPQMLSGKVEGRFLQMLIRISGAKMVVEIGTFTGYSTLIMAEGLPEDGEMLTLEISQEYADLAQRYFRKSIYTDKIKLIVGPALDTLKRIPDNSIDFVFIDADKVSYILYYEQSFRILRNGGFIAVDNTLWSGSVLSPHDDESRAIALFNEKVKKDERVEKVMLTIRDGIYLIRKK
jgi:caffeoyl-CoA O-methyltransferase